MDERGDAPPLLLPAGFSDMLPPYAEQEARIVRTLMDCFTAAGFERVKPPMMESETALRVDAHRGEGNLFRLMDPSSRRMMALRSDFTVQVARIARTRLAHQRRPLRLSYYGEALCARGNLLHPERQYAQAGIETFGASGHHADLEVLTLGVEALRSVGIGKLTVDLNTPSLTESLLLRYGFAQDTMERLRQSLDRKDLPAIAAHGGEAAEVLVALEKASGPLKHAARALRSVKLPDAVKGRLESLLKLAEDLKAKAPDIAITVDPLENRGLAYHTGVTFSYFTQGYKSDLGRGGRYRPHGNALPMHRLLARSQDSAVKAMAEAQRDHHRHESEKGGEEATGLTLFIEALRACCPTGRTQNKRVYAPLASDSRKVAELRRKGWVIIAQLEKGGDPESEARACGCEWLLREGRPAAIT